MSTDAALRTEKVEKLLSPEELIDAKIMLEGLLNLIGPDSEQEREKVQLYWLETYEIVTLQRPRRIK
jgi:hypothetical protein